ncbi:hypothetical protein RRF57_008478 [Xylaria bambusicola]|uniref:Uncharacterized protein n=1 Tax=Xylaria bambusicola TaxID=326684 RepID=A0AAN7V1S9_9PEZI
MPHHPSKFFVPYPEFDPWINRKFRRVWRRSARKAPLPPDGQRSGGTAGLKRTYFSNSSSEAVPSISNNSSTGNNEKECSREGHSDDK